MERNNHSSFRSDARPPATTSSDFVLRWGTKKRLRCMKVQTKDLSNNNSDSRITTRVDRRVVRSDPNKDVNPNSVGIAGKSNGYLNLRQRPPSPSHRILRKSDSSIAMRGQSNGVRGLASPDRGNGHEKRSAANNNSNRNISTYQNNDNHHHGSGSGGGSASSETKKGGSSSGSDTITAVWPPKFAIALTSKEKEEDFLAIKGSKLPQRPKKRAKFIQRTLNLVSPGAWLCDLTLERYEVREKKVSKKRPRGLKAMGNMDSDSE